ncbi:MAG: hypothetical protein L6R41_005559 [Letrouitia leprolyta]|nr:MAG: hypothetical protein L6R41_005559 [Letrouitia leprolyta]
MSQCCLSGFAWNGTPSGKEDKLGNLNAYIATPPAKSDVAILFIHDIFGWKFTNNRLLSDHFAKEINATVYLPDFFDGEVVEEDTVYNDNKRAAFDFKAWAERHSKEKRGPAITEAARALKQDLGFKKVAAVGYCYGGWASFYLGAKGRSLIDCISIAHPSFLTKEEIDAVDVPVQILAPETDPQFTPELKAHANKVIPDLGLEYDYQYFPGLVHGFAARADLNNKAEKEGFERAKNAVVTWFCTILQMR